MKNPFNLQVQPELYTLFEYLNNTYDIKNYDFYFKYENDLFTIPITTSAKEIILCFSITLPKNNQSVASNYLLLTDDLGNILNFGVTSYIRDSKLKNIILKNLSSTSAAMSAKIIGLKINLV